MDTKHAFELMTVTLEITPSTVKDEWCYMMSTQKKSPLEYQGTSEECAALFSIWLKNTMKAMLYNRATKITIKASWDKKKEI